MHHYYPEGNLFYTDYYGADGILKNRETFSKDGTLRISSELKHGKIFQAKMFYNKKYLGQYFRKNKFLYDSEIYLGGKIYNGSGTIDSLGREVGWWTLYDANNIIQKRFYLVLDNEPIETQTIDFNHGRIDSLKSKFADITFVKTPAENVHIGKITYSRQLNDKSYVSILIEKEIDGIFSLNAKDYDTINFQTKSKMDFPVKFEKTGKKNLRGFFVEQYFDKKLNRMKEMRVPFEKEIIIN